MVAVSRHNVDSIGVFELLHKIVKLLKSYFGGYVDEEVMRKNFILVYELLDGSWAPCVGGCGARR